MEFRLLGLLEVEDEHGPVRIVPGRESALLALLLLRRGDPLSTARIVEELWGEAASENATKAVQVYVSRLRKTLGADRIETTPAGYRIAVRVGELDVDRFEELVRGGRHEAALALWRGEPLADFRYAPFALPEARRLEELRNTALADALDARLARGEAPVAELEALVVQEPLWERPRAQLMHALYLAGRQAEALDLYRRTRELLDEELGVEPGPELQRVERAILNHDPELGKPTRAKHLPAPQGRRLLLIGGLVLVAASVAAAVVAATRDGRSLSTVQANSVAAIEARTGRIVAQIAVGNRPSRLAVSPGRLWVLNAGDSTITEIDTAAERAVAEFGPAAVPSDLAATPGTVWVGTANRGAATGITAVARFDAARRTSLGTRSLRGEAGAGGRPPEEREMVATPYGVWAIGPSLEPVQLDRRTGRVDQIAHDVFASSLAYGLGKLWAVADSDVVPIDARTGDVGKRIPVSALFYLGGITTGGGSVWVSSPEEGVVWRIEPGVHERTTSISLAYGAASVAFAGGYVWVANRYDGSIDRIDPHTTPPTVSHVATVPAPLDIVADATRVFVAAGAPAGRTGPVSISSCGPDRHRGAVDVRIVSDLPLTGPFAIQSAAAVRTIESTLAARGHRAGRFHVGFQSCDDSTAAAGSFDDGQCVANATAFADDPSVIGVIGPLNSECARYEIPILNRAPQGPLSIVSPFATGPFLSRPPPGAAAATFRQFYAGGPHNFTRTIGADHIQVAADATLAKRLHLHRVAVLYDTERMLDRAEESWFVQASDKLGIDAIPILVDPNRRTFQRALRRARADGAFVAGYALGTDPQQGRPVAAELDRDFTGRPVIVTDAFPAPAAERSTARFYATSASPNPAAAIEALLTAIATSNGTRRSVLARLLARRGIDRWGDPLTAPIRVLRLPSGAHAATITPSIGVVPRS